MRSCCSMSLIATVTLRGLLGTPGDASRKSPFFIRGLKPPPRVRDSNSNQSERGRKKLNPKMKKAKSLDELNLSTSSRNINQFES